VNPDKFFSWHPQQLSNFAENQLLNWVVALQVIIQRPMPLLTDSQHPRVFTRAIVLQRTALAFWNWTLECRRVNISSPQDVKHLSHLLNCLCGTTDNC